MAGKRGGYLAILLIFVVLGGGFFLLRNRAFTPGREEGQRAVNEARLSGERQLGRAEVPSPPRRIISLAPNVTEILFALGLEREIVGVTTWCDYPPQAKRIAKIGDMTPNLEKILDLKPDLVIGMQSLQERDLRRLKEHNLPVLSVDARDLAGTLALIETLGKVTGRQTRAKELRRTLEARLARVEAATRSVPAAQRPRVLMLLEMSPALFTVGPGSLQDELIRRAGGVNIAGDAKQPWPQLSEETILARNPQVLILTRDFRREIRRRKAWQEIEAVAKGRIYVVDPDIYSRPGPRIVDALADLAGILQKARGE